MTTKAEIRDHARKVVQGGLALIRRAEKAPDWDHDVPNLVVHFQGGAPTADLNLGREEDVIPFAIWGDPASLETWYEEADRAADDRHAMVDMGRHGGTDLYLVKFIEKPGWTDHLYPGNEPGVIPMSSPAYVRDAGEIRYQLRRARHRPVRADRRACSCPRARRRS